MNEEDIEEAADIILSDIDDVSDPEQMSPQEAIDFYAAIQSGLEGRINGLKADLD